MPRLNIYIPAMKLSVIDLYCKERKVSRSALLTNCALSMINATRGNVRCDFCGKPALGKYNMTVYDYESGEAGGVKKLCAYHKKKAENEGATLEEI